MRALRLATLGLAAGGLALGFVGWRMRSAEVDAARSDQVERARREAAGAAVDVAAFVRTEGIGALKDLREPDHPEVEESRGLFTDAIEMADDERLLFDEAEFRSRTRADDPIALDLYRRLADRSRTRDLTDDLARLCALRLGALAALAGREEEAREQFGVAAGARRGLWDPTGEHVRSAARYGLARLDLAKGRGDAVDAFLATLDFDVNAPDGVVVPAELAVALAAEARSRPALAKATALRLEKAAERARRMLAWRDRLSVAKVAVEGGEIGIRFDAHYFEVAPLSVLDRLTNFARGRVSTLRVMPAGEGAGVARAPIGPPLEGLDVVASLSHPAEVGSFGLIALVAALAVYAVGSAFALASLRRSVRTAEMQADFMASVSHEMKTPVAAVQAMAEMLADGRVEDPERARLYAQRMEGEMRRLGASVRNVLDAARIERGGDHAVRPRPTEPGSVVRDLVEAWRPSLEARGFRLAEDVAEAPTPMRLDPDALTSIVANLVDNAAKFSGERKEIDVLGRPEAGAYRVEVLDRGPGVSESESERIFDRFWRGAAARDQAVPGVGLGLHVARALARAHGGSLRVHAREGGGARFVLRLPVHTAVGARS